MKYKLKIETEWPDIAKKRDEFTYIDLFDWSLTPKVREHFFIDNGVVYEHRIDLPPEKINQLIISINIIELRKYR